MHNRVLLKMLPPDIPQVCEHCVQRVQRVQGPHSPSRGLAKIQTVIQPFFKNQQINK